MPAAECSSFLLQVNLYIRMQPQQFPSENAKVAFLISLLTVAACYPVPEPMQVDLTRLSRIERNHCISLGLCLYCGHQGHLICNCPVRPPRPVVSTIQSEAETAPLTLLPVLLRTAKHSLSVSALVDSGSSGNLISQECLNQLHLSRQHHFQEFAVKTIQGKPLGRGRIRHSSPYITLQVGLFHSEKIRFLVLEDSTVSIILGRPWLHQHLPQLRWDPCDVTHWSDRRYEQCLSNIPRPPPIPIHLSSTQVESPEPEIPPEIPAKYMAFQNVFSKQAATHLPPHRPWDCAIELLPGAQLPKGRIYPLSILEHQAMEEYIAEALKQGFIQLSTSPAALSFFFVGKKDGGLHPCIDYHQFNSQIIQQSYPLPLVPAALEELRGARVFMKLDLRSAYNLFRIRAGDKWKTAFTTPTRQCRMVFREFLHRFVVVYIDDILIYSRNQAQHRQYFQQVLQKLCEHSLFLKLEKCEFHHPSVQFLGYNISAEGVQMDQAEQNYDVENLELLAIKLALEEWRHWLEGANHPFTIITDHNNLQYLREARRLNPRQARWALFLIRFNFKITYQPGSKNVAADTLSRRFSQDSPSDPEPIVGSAQKGRSTCLAPNANPFWAQLTNLRVLDTQEADGPSRSYNLVTGGAVCTVIPSGTSKAAQPVPSLTLPVNYLQESWFHYPSHRGPGSILEWISSQTCQVPKEETVSDRGPQFISHVWKAFFKLLGVSVNLSSSYHPQTKGQTERKIQELGCYLRAYCHKDQHSWSSLHCFPGRRNPLMFQLSTTGFERARECGTQHTIISSGQCADKNFADTRRRAAPLYQPGDLVWLSTRDLPRYIGPFRILRQINEVTFQFHLSPRYRIHPTFHVSMILLEFHRSHPDHPAPCGHREPPLEEGVMSGIHHSHLHLPPHPWHRPLVPHHQSSDYTHLYPISHALYKTLSLSPSLSGLPFTTPLLAPDPMLLLLGLSGAHHCLPAHRFGLQIRFLSHLYILHSVYAQSVNKDSTVFTHHWSHPCVCVTVG
ncbi:hypothetical protein M9458_056981 [Cirrhinus mrigala]|uniref:Reverse transcriptase n=1 Tax=Cirrhinus mrigala TaxID=683832 RepID=A0ABD0MF73_CIRMR